MPMSVADYQQRTAFSLRAERRLGARLAWRIARLFPDPPEVRSDLRPNTQDVAPSVS